MTRHIPTTGETWLICGGRYFKDTPLFERSMKHLLERYGRPARIIHGDATGADSMADDLAKQLGIAIQRFPADWRTHGKAAGPIRNSQMIDEGPDRVVAFPGGRGTKDMVRKARRAGIGITEFGECPE